MPQPTEYRVKKIFGRKKMIEVSVPGSKSITNRALLMSALAEGESLLKGALFSDDSRDMMACLRSLGIEIREDEEKKEILVQGMGGRLPVKEGEIYVGNSGIAARFITVLVAFSGGKFRLTSGRQMKKRPMKELISALTSLGVNIICEEEEGHFPFRLEAEEIRNKRIAIDINVSSQFLSALLMSGFLLPDGIEIAYTGRGAVLPYVEMTIKVMKEFGVEVEMDQERSRIRPAQSAKGRVYEIEPDVSSACYFYAMAVLLNCEARVRGVHLNSIQGDIRFVELLDRFGASLVEGEEGLTVIGNVEHYTGIEVNLNACSDQTMTLAALALFAKSHTIIKGVAHIRKQESDRLFAIYNEVIRLGAKAKMGEGEITIFPLLSESQETKVETYGDHRMAMAFTLVGLRRGGVVIKNPSCVKKSFENYFELIEKIEKE